MIFLLHQQGYTKISYLKGIYIPKLIITQLVTQLVTQILAQWVVSYYLKTHEWINLLTQILTQWVDLEF
jgi:hypothetical protein